MESRHLFLFRTTCAALVAGLFAAAIYFMHQSGCTADLKAGSTGDIAEALRLESQGTAYGLASGALWVLLVASFARSAIGRVGVAIASGLLFYAVFLAGAFQAAVEATKPCLYSHSLPRAYCLTSHSSGHASGAPLTLNVTIAPSFFRSCQSV